MNPFPQFLFVAQSTANLKPEEACVRIHKSGRKIPLHPHAGKGTMARSRNVIGTGRPIVELPVRLVAIAFAFCLRILPYFAAFCRGKSFIFFVCNSIRGLIIRRSQVRVLPPPPIKSITSARGELLSLSPVRLASGLRVVAGLLRGCCGVVATFSSRTRSSRSTNPRRGGAELQSWATASSRHFLPTPIRHTTERRMLAHRSVMKVLVCCHRNVVEVHIRQVPVAVLMVVEVDTDGLTLVGSQVKGLLGPRATVGADLHDLRQQGARRVLYLGLLPVVRNRVGGGRQIGRASCRERV